MHLDQIVPPSNVCELAGLSEFIEQQKKHLAHLLVHTLTQILGIAQAVGGANLDVSVPDSIEPKAETTNDKCGCGCQLCLG